MAQITGHSTQKSSVGLSTPLTYQEVVDLLDRQWQVTDRSLERMKKLDAALGSPAKDLNSIAVAGTNGKSLTVHFIAKLLQAEGLTVGSFSSPHILSYNERIAFNTEAISNKNFTDLANEVIAAARTANLQCNSSEILAAMAWLNFKQHKVDVVVMEVGDLGQFDPASLCNTKVLAITRVTDDELAPWHKDANQIITELTTFVRPNTWVASADQNKANLQLMADHTVANKGHWAMPIRKLVALAYPFEQLHGRCAALAERAAQLFVENVIVKDAMYFANSLLTRPKGQRGRPTTEAKKTMEANPKRTLEHFWKNEPLSNLTGKFQILDKDKPTILLDNASNIDALRNVLLGIRLLHYQRPFKGLAVILGACKDTFHHEEFLKAVRYFFRKTSGSIVICPVQPQSNTPVAQTSWNAEQITNDLKTLKIKARASKDLKDAYEFAKKSVDERNGLIVIAGSNAVINEYLELKGVKRA
jgi:folylpolyglutamate synthase/dihydrofolate synthase